MFHVYKEKCMENKFSLTKYNKPLSQEPVQVKRAQQVIYGETELKRGINDVLNTVIPHYNYSTLEELNAVLRLYNIMAHRGKEDSHLYLTRGLLYNALNEQGWYWDR